MILHIFVSYFKILVIFVFDYRQKLIKTMRIAKKYNMKLKTLIPILGLAGASMFSACERNEPIPQHDTIYTFGKGNWFDAEEEQNIVASADSATVRYVILENNGKTYNGSTVRVTAGNMKLLIKRIPAEKQQKVKGSGILREMTINSQEDSTYLANMGFKFVDAIPYSEYIQKHR